MHSVLYSNSHRRLHYIHTVKISIQVSFNDVWDFSPFVQSYKTRVIRGKRQKRLGYLRILVKSLRGSMRVQLVCLKSLVNWWCIPTSPSKHIWPDGWASILLIRLSGCVGLTEDWKEPQILLLTLSHTHRWALYGSPNDSSTMPLLAKCGHLFGQDLAPRVNLVANTSRHLLFLSLRRLSD